VATVNTSSLYG